MPLAMQMPADVIAETLRALAAMSVEAFLNASLVRIARFSACDEMRSRSAPPNLAVFGRPVSSRLRFEGA